MVSGNISSKLYSLSSGRDDATFRFGTGVSTGMHTVGFFNSVAERDTSGSNKMLASYSFGLAADSSSERSSFCADLLQGLKSNLDGIQLMMEMEAYSMAAKTKDKPGLNNSGKPGEPIKATGENHFKNEENPEDAINKMYNENYFALKQLTDINSDADIQFKILKEAAEAKQAITIQEFFAAKIQQAGGSGGIFGAGAPANSGNSGPGGGSSNIKLPGASFCAMA